jgi:toxin-antitoxin system PIN domain toxin
MLAPDVNILIYAHRREDPSHLFYKNWMEGLVGSHEPFALSVLVAVAFVRIVTHPGFSTLPTPLPQALAVIDELLQQPGCRLLHPSEQHWPLVRKLAASSRAQGPAIGDIQHAALAMEYGCTWVTRDRDFEKLSTSGLRLKILAPSAG